MAEIALPVSGTPAPLLAGMLGEGGDAATLALPALLRALHVALAEPGCLTDKADWILAVARILERRSRLLLPRAPDGEQEGTAPTPLRAQNDGLAEARALALWLGARPQLGQEVFPRGDAGEAAGTGGVALDVIEFLWASIAVFEGILHPADAPYRPVPPALHSVAEARGRILERLAEAPAGLGLSALLPPAAGDALRRRSAWSSTFAAGLELAKSGAVTLDQTVPERPPVLRRPREAAVPEKAGPSAHPKGEGASAIR